MPFQERDMAYVWDMLFAAKEATVFAGVLSLEEFRNHSMARSAVERKLEIIGEAARNLSEVFRESHPEIPWRQIVGLKNILVHEYSKVNCATVHELVQNDLPDFISKLEFILKANPPKIEC